MLNKVILMGRLTADPELKQTPNGVSVTSFTLAVERNYAPQGTERQTDFINCVAWRQTAEFISKYFGKGRMMAAEGSLQVRNYTDKNDNKRQAVEVIVDQAYFADSKNGTQSNATNANSNTNVAHANASSANVGYTTPVTPTEDFQEIDDEDDLPF